MLCHSSGAGISVLNTLECPDMQKNQAQYLSPVRLLVIYMITTLLFLMSVDLHIHPPETAMTAEHGAAVSISSISGKFISPDDCDEICVNPDTVLKGKQVDSSILVVFLLVVVMLSILLPFFVGRLRDAGKGLPVIPFHGSPSLRAPPQ